MELLSNVTNQIQWQQLVTWENPSELMGVIGFFLSICLFIIKIIEYIQSRPDIEIIVEKIKCSVENRYGDIRVEGIQRVLDTVNVQGQLKNVPTHTVFICLDVLIKNHSDKPETVHHPEVVWHKPILNGQNRHSYFYRFIERDQLTISTIADPDKKEYRLKSHDSKRLRLILEFPRYVTTLLFSDVSTIVEKRNNDILKRIPSDMELKMNVVYGKGKKKTITFSLNKF